MIPLGKCPRLWETLEAQPVGMGGGARRGGDTGVRPWIVRAALVLAALLAVAAPSRAMAATETLIIGTEGDYAPFSYTEADGTLGGFDVDIAHALCAAMQMTCEIVAVPWGALIPALNDRRIDAIIASMSITEERKQLVAFTNRYYRTPMQFIARKGSRIDVSPEHLRGKRVAVEADTTAHKYLLSHGDIGMDMRIFATQSEANRALMRGEADLLIADSLVMWALTKTPEGSAFEFVGAPIYADEGIGIAVRQGDEALLQAFNRAILRLRIDGTYDRINAKYFPFSIY